MKLKLPAKLKKKLKLKLSRKPKSVFDISAEENSQVLTLYWGYAKTSKFRDTMAYLKGRYDEGHPVGDFLKENLRIQLEV